jgi:hypothetical protein
MPKYAGELRVGDIWTERPQGRAPHSYRVITIEPGLTRITVRVKAVSVITGKPRMFNFFLVNRVEVHEGPASDDASLNGACRS